MLFELKFIVSNQQLEFKFNDESFSFCRSVVLVQERSKHYTARNKREKIRFISILTAVNISNEISVIDVAVYLCIPQAKTDAKN